MKAEEAIAAGENRLAHLRLSLSVADEGLIRDLVGALKDLAAENERLRQERDAIYKEFIGRDGMHLPLAAALRERFAAMWKLEEGIIVSYAKGRADMAEESAKHVDDAFSIDESEDAMLSRIAQELRALSAAAPTNQCDGCNSGMPIEDGIHQHNGHPHMCCTKGKYSAAVPVEV